SIGKARRPGGTREGGFPGDQKILDQLTNKNQTRKRVGLIADGRAPVRAGAPLYDANNHLVGQVTSGLFSPSLERPIAMAYVETAQTHTGTSLLAEVRGKRLP